jgi:pimeloyl-[acyl-carrier protein] methyl ester esterase
VSLYVEQRGNGPDLVMLHGWGLHGGLFASIADRLVEQYRLHLVDLPGHGRSSMPEDDYTLENLATQIAAAVPTDAVWLGWSLGGRIALTAAASVNRVSKLILVGANPCFVQQVDWPHAMPEAELAQFANSLRDDYRATLQRFVALQSRGSERGRDELRRLRETLFDHGEPDKSALAAGLQLLGDADLRSLLSTIQQPTLILHGERDTLAPLAAAEYTATQIPNAKLVTINGAGHAPFISHPEEFIAAIEEFV